MSIFQKMMKSGNDEAELSDKRASNLAKKIMGMQELYIILSTKQANMENGVSVPYVCQTEDHGKGILTFSTKSYARKYIEQHQFEILDGIYPVGKIEVQDKINGLQTVLATANALGASFMDFNPSFQDNAMGFHISWFMQENKLDKNVSILLTKKQYEKMLSENQNSIPLHFNPIKIEDFDFKYHLTEDASRAILKKVFEGHSVSDYVTIFNEESLFECCHTMDYIYCAMIPKAQQNKKNEDVPFFQSVAEVLETVVKNKLKEQNKLYTLVDPKTDKIFTKNGFAYILYTDRYKYMGAYDYVPINQNSIEDFLKSQGVSKAMVTDGPHGMAMIQY